MSVVVISSAKETLFVGDAANPRHAHDCGCCSFIGNYEEFDLYHCTNERGFVARYGVDGDYMYTDEKRASSYASDHPLRLAAIAKPLAMR
jgi:hypothetical protein